MPGVRPSRTLWVLRHAKAVAAPPDGGTDHDRPLVPRGSADAEALGRRLGAAGDRLGLGTVPLPAVVLCSTAVRAVETTDRAIASFAARPRVLLRRALYGADVDGVLAEVRTVDDVVTALMVVGHNPALEELVSIIAGASRHDGALTSGRPLARLGLATCGVAVVTLAADRWRDVDAPSGEIVGRFAPPY